MAGTRQRPKLKDLLSVWQCVFKKRVIAIWIFNVSWLCYYNFNGLLIIACRSRSYTTLSGDSKGILVHPLEDMTKRKCPPLVKVTWVLVLDLRHTGWSLPSPVLFNHGKLLIKERQPHKAPVTRYSVCPELLSISDSFGQHAMELLDTPTSFVAALGTSRKWTLVLMRHEVTPSGREFGY